MAAADLGCALWCTCRLSGRGGLFELLRAATRESNPRTSFHLWVAGAPCTSRPIPLPCQTNSYADPGRPSRHSHPAAATFTGAHHSALQVATTGRKRRISAELIRSDPRGGHILRISENIAENCRGNNWIPTCKHSLSPCDDFAPGVAEEVLLRGPTWRPTSALSKLKNIILKLLLGDQILQNFRNSMLRMRSHTVRSRVFRCG